MSAYVPPYIYNVLPPANHFRVLVLEPGTDNAPLRCTLHDASLDKTLYFECISYVWGTSQRTAELLCHERNLLITPSLEAVLRRVRLSDRTRTVWADSVCINQNDLDEKSYQVALMGEIYRKSSRTLICIGNDDQYHAENTCALISEIHDGMLSNTEPGWDTFPLLEADHPLPKDPRWASFGKLMTATWFTRGWCVQEAAFAKDGRLLWGQYEISWSQLMRVYLWVLGRTPEICLEIGIPTPHISAYSVVHQQDVQAFMSEDRWQGLGKTLETFHVARSMGLTDPRDRIYAFLSLLTDGGAKSLNIIPDYRKTFLEVCQDFAIGYLNSYQDLDLLLYVHHSEQSMNTNFPSWIPVWDLDESHSQDIEGMRAEQPPIINLDASIKLDDRKLQIYGICFSSIKYVSESIAPETTTLDLIAQLWSQVCDVQPEQCAVDADRLLMFTTSLVSGIVGTDQAKHLRNLAAFILEIYRRSGRNAVDAYENRWKNQAIGGSADEFLAYINIYSPARRLVVSERGYGMGPLAAQVGDKCAIIYGTKSLFLVRDADHTGECRLVGALFHSSEKEWEQHEANWTIGIGLEDGRDWENWGLQPDTMLLI